MAWPRLAMPSSALFAYDRPVAMAAARNQSKRNGGKPFQRGAGLHVCTCYHGEEVAGGGDVDSTGGGSNCALLRSWFCFHIGVYTLLVTLTHTSRKMVHSLWIHERTGNKKRLGIMMRWHSRVQFMFRKMSLYTFSVFYEIVQWRFIGVFFWPCSRRMHVAQLSWNAACPWGTTYFDRLACKQRPCNSCGKKTFTTKEDACFLSLW